MNLLLLPAGAAPPYHLPARDPRFEHARGVLRLKPGDRFQVGRENGALGWATVEALSDEGVAFTVAWEAQRPPLPPPVCLAVALSRPQTLRHILREATTLGVRAFHVFPAQRSDPAYARSRLWQDQAYQQDLRLGAEQACDTFLPEVRLHPCLTSAVEALAETPQRRLLDVYGAEVALQEALPQHLDCASCAPQLALAIGPERGWAEGDRRTLLAAGWQRVHLGPRVLRVETAACVALGAVSLRAGRPPTH